MVGQDQCGLGIGLRSSSQVPWGWSLALPLPLAYNILIPLASALMGGTPQEPNLLDLLCHAAPPVVCCESKDAYL